MSDVAYCVKCKKKQSIVNPKQEPTPKGAIRVYGTCGKCGTKVTTFKSGKKKSGGKSRSRKSRKTRSRK